MQTPAGRKGIAEAAAVVLFTPDHEGKAYERGGRTSETTARIGRITHHTGCHI